MNNKHNNGIPYSRHIISLICVAIIAGGGAYQLNEIKHEREKVNEVNRYPHSSDLEKVTSTYETIVSDYVGEIDKEALIDGAIKGMTTALDDPYSDYFSGDDAESLNSTIDGSFEGIGATMSMENEQPVIAEKPMKNSPAENADLKIGDIITKVDGKETKGRTLNDVVETIKGKKGTDVTLTILRGDETFDVTLTRDEIALETVKGTLDETDKTVGYIEVKSFTKHTAEEFEEAVTALRKDGAKSFVVDVRNNPGGLLDQVAKMSSMFLKNGKTIVSFEDKDQNKQELVAGKELDGGFKIKEPTVVLVNGSSASASEIFAAALNESAKIPVIGSTTFGKGTVQTVNSLENNTDLKLTTSKWLTPKGEWIHEKGFEPSVKVELPDYYESSAIDRKESYEEGAKSPEIKNLNLVLSGIDESVSADSDTYTAETIEAVKKVQETDKLPVTGIVDDETASAIELKLISKMTAKDLPYEKALEEVKKLK
ncbi:S41 family peptidase [uncultured Vagococcus sp.]|uniref:S41 family peptidase n=1 Tax=uncultured Vagococcus sp. TaxID=189676 RepID=UPI0028D527B0|nr:S41 family peptidase [uncultured Vagococcus sp.]